MKHQFNWKELSRHHELKSRLPKKVTMQTHPKNVLAITLAILTYEATGCEVVGPYEAYPLIVPQNYSGNYGKVEAELHCYGYDLYSLVEKGENDLNGKTLTRGRHLGEKERRELKRGYKYEAKMEPVRFYMYHGMLTTNRKKIISCASKGIQKEGNTSLIWRRKTHGPGVKSALIAMS